MNRWTGLAFGLVILCAAGCKDSSGPDDTPPPDPVALSVVGQGTVTERYTSEIAVRGNTAYTGSWSRRGTRDGNAVKIWNVAGATPVLVDSLLVPGAGTTGDVQISDDGTILAIASEYFPVGTLSLYSLANPVSPQLLSRFTTPEISRGVHTVKLGRVNGRHYAFLSINPAGSTRARLVIADITTPSAPQQVFAAFMGSPYVHDVFVRDGFLFTALWDDGLTIWDIGGGTRGGTPSNPVQVGNVKTVGGAVHNVYWFRDKSGATKYAIIGEEQITNPSSGDIHVVDVSDKTNPREVAFYHVPAAGTHNFAVDENKGILYAAYYEAGVRALDITGNLGSCTTEEKALDGRCDLGLMKRERGFALKDMGVKIWGVALNSTHLFASDMFNGIWKLDNSALR